MEQQVYREIPSVDLMIKDDKIKVAIVNSNTISLGQLIHLNRSIVEPANLNSRNRSAAASLIQEPNLD
jgi:hypothetical protein